MGRRVPFEQNLYRTAMHSSTKRMLTSQSPERSTFSVESLRGPGWPDST